MKNKNVTLSEDFAAIEINHETKKVIINAKEPNSVGLVKKIIDALMRETELDALEIADEYSVKTNYLKD